MDFCKEVYMTLNGQYCPGQGVPGVENAFETGEPCEALYASAYAAYQRICDRLGVRDEDADLETIFQSFLEINHILCIKMFHYGNVFSNNMGD